jgi:hypothetical protein
LAMPPRHHQPQHYLRRWPDTTRNTTEASLVHRRLAAARHATTTSQAPAQTSRCQPHHHDTANTIQAESAIARRAPPHSPTEPGPRARLHAKAGGQFQPLGRGTGRPMGAAAEAHPPPDAGQAAGQGPRHRRRKSPQTARPNMPRTLGARSGG